MTMHPRLIRHRSNVPLVSRDPICGDFLLRFRKTDLASADHGVHPVFQAILGIRTPSTNDVMRFRPKVPWVGWGSPGLQGHEVIKFVVVHSVVRVTILTDQLAFQRLGVTFRRADRAGVPARPADGFTQVRLRHGRIDRPRRDSRVGKCRRLREDNAITALGIDTARVTSRILFVAPACSFITMIDIALSFVSANARRCVSGNMANEATNTPSKSSWPCDRERCADSCGDDALIWLDQSASSPSLMRAACRCSYASLRALSMSPARNDRAIFAAMSLIFFERHHALRPLTDVCRLYALWGTSYLMMKLSPVTKPWLTHELFQC